MDAYIHDDRLFANDASSETVPAALLGDPAIITLRTEYLLWKAVGDNRRLKSLQNQVRIRIGNLTDELFIEISGHLDLIHEARRILASPHIAVDPKTGIEWVSGTRSAYDADGNPLPEGERACVEVTVIPGRAASGWA